MRGIPASGETERDYKAAITVSPAPAMWEGALNSGLCITPAAPRSSRCLAQLSEREIPPKLAQDSHAASNYLPVPLCYGLGASSSFPPRLFVTMRRSTSSGHRSPQPGKDSESRKRSMRACLSCRSRKVRCDVSSRGQPCTNCDLDGKNCLVVGRASRLYFGSEKIIVP